MIIFKFLLFIVIKIRIFCNSKQEIEYFLTSTPIYKISQQILCEGGSVEKILLASYEEDTFLTFSSICGLQVIQVDQAGFKIVRTFDIRQKIKASSIEKNQNYLWIADENNIFYYQIRGKFNDLRLLGQFKKDSSESGTRDFVFSEDGYIMFIVNIKEVVIYNIANQDHPIYVQTIKSSSNVYLLFFIPQKETLVIGNESADFYRTVYQTDINSPSFVDTQSVCNHRLIILPSVMQLVANKYIIFISEVYGIATLDISSYFNSRICTNLKINYLYGLNRIQGMKYGLITKDQNYLISLTNYQYIQIYEIQYAILEQVDSINLVLFEQIKVIDVSYDMKFFQGQNCILYLDFDELQLFKIIEPNANKIGPNLLNISQNVVFNSNDKIPIESRRCRYHQGLLYLAKLDGFYIFQKNIYNNYIKQVGKWNSSNKAIEALAILKNNKQAIVGSVKLFFLDISDLNDIKQVASTDLGNPEIDADDICLSQDEKTLLIAVGYRGMYIVDISHFSEPKLISKIFGINIETASSENIDIDNKNEYVYTSYRSQGIAIYDVRDLKQPKLASFFYTGWAESIDITEDDKYLIIADKQRGVVILNITNPYSPSEISRISLRKETFRVRLIWKDQYVIATNVRSEGQISLIDIRNKQNPKVIQSYAYKRLDGSTDFCISSDNQIGFVPLVSDFIVIMNLKLKQQFNMDLQLIKKGSKQIDQFYYSDEPLQVGMTVNMMITRIYPQKYSQITEVFFYDNFQNFQLPSWAIFNSRGQFVTLDITKESLISQREASLLSSTQNIKGQKTFVFKISEIIEENDFIQDEIGIDKDLSKQIYIQCIIESIIDSQQMIKEYSEEVITYIFQNKYSSDIIQQIVYTLKSKISFLPFHLDIKNSLYLNLDLPNGDVVDTISDVVLIEVSIPNSDARFKHSLYTSVIMYYSEDYYTIKLEGDIKSVNSVLNSGIKIANFKDPKLILLYITVDDKFNYPIKTSFKASHPYLVNLNKPVILNPELTLQDDFSSKFEDSEVYILESFRYTFSSDVFIDKDDQILTYSFEIMLKSYWISFSPSERTFEGRPTTSQYGDEYIIQVTATDGFTENSQILKIKVKKLPITYLLSLLSKILGVVLGVFGFIKKRSSIYNVLFRYQYTISTITVFAGEQVSYQIPLLEDSLTQGKLIWQSFIKKIGHQLIQKEVRIIKQKCDSYQKLNKSSLFSQSQKKPQLFSQKDIHQNQHLNDFEEDKILTSEQILFNSIRMSPKHREQLVKRTQNQIIKKNQLLNKVILSKNLNQEQLSIDLMFFEEISFDLNEVKIISTIKKFYETCQNPSLKNINDLENINSKLSRVILSQALEEIANNEQQCKSVISFLLKIAISQGYTKHDWYKHYVIIQTQFDEILNNPFPSVVVNKERIQFFINQLNNNADNSQLLSQVTLNLVYQYIFYSTLGMMKLTQAPFSKLRGECIELFPHQIQGFKCYKKVFVKRSYARQMKQTVVERELSLNQKLPSWIQVLDLQYGVIIIKGNPSNKDCGKIILKILDTSNFIIKQFTLEIKQRNENESQVDKIENIFQKEYELEQLIPDEIDENGIDLNWNSQVISSIKNKFVLELYQGDSKQID